MFGISKGIRDGLHLAQGIPLVAGHMAGAVLSVQLLCFHKLRIHPGFFIWSVLFFCLPVLADLSQAVIKVIGVFRLIPKGVGDLCKLPCQGVFIAGGVSIGVCHTGHVA